jgi:hypothetical protein
MGYRRRVQGLQPDGYVRTTFGRVCAGWKNDGETMMYLRLDEDRIMRLERAAEWTARQCEGQIVRVYRDHARERAELVAKREAIAERLGVSDAV